MTYRVEVGCGTCGELYSEVFTFEGKLPDGLKSNPSGISSECQDFWRHHQDETREIGAKTATIRPHEGRFVEFIEAVAIKAA